MPSAERARAAPAKINLFLHVGARGADGYHPLVSWVVFADVADRLRAAPAGALSLAIDGPFATGLPADADNLVLRAAAALAPGRGAALALTKNLPVASGIGGGSADAAAALLLLDDFWGLRRGADALAQIGLALGADVPMCLAGEAALAEGRGERLSLAPRAPALDLVLVNPGLPAPTAEVFARLTARTGATRPSLPAAVADAREAAAALAPLRNDLETPALSLAPAVADVLTALRRTDACLLARMSGSGATCFGLYPDAESAARAAAALAAARPDWWVAPTRTRSAPPPIEG